MPSLFSLNHFTNSKPSVFEQLRLLTSYVNELEKIQPEATHIITDAAKLVTIEKSLREVVRILFL